ncbi:PAS domain S-box protein [Amphritea opalescens]|uniref:C4-dicarboxylate transport sensor protein DctB n=1 Tax=Amphritea opalescens TaxID=2490544 RepID=A0A430KLV8_9GAMM|nr:ATP-binding protein [Amphritea opalescens]RTE64446.1 PAS domain S-box protein [Amphritea opalescens]
MIKIRLRPLLLLSLVTLFVVVIFETILVSHSRATDDLQQSASAGLNRYILSLQQELDRYKDLPKLLSSHSELVNLLLLDGNEGVYRANLYLQKVNDTVGASDTYLMDTNGTTLASSNWQKAHTFVGRNFSFRPYFRDAMAGRAGRYFALGTTSKKRGYFFSYPVEYRGTVLGVIVVKIDLNDIETEWSDPMTDIVVTDEDGVIFISTRAEWKFRTLKPLQPQDLQRIVASLRYGNHELTSLPIVERKALGESEVVTLIEGDRIDNPALDGIETRQYLQQTRTVEDAGFNVSILADLKPVDRRVLNNVLLTGFVYSALVFLVLLLLARRRISLERARFKRQQTLALERSEARIRAIIDNTHAGLITLDIHGVIESFNPTAEKLFGYSSDRITGEYFSKLISQPDRAVCWRHISQQRDDDESAELMVEVACVRADGSPFPVELIIGRMADNSASRFVVTIHDITERKENEEQLREARDQLEQRVDERTQDLTRANARLLQEVEEHKNTQDELIQTAKLAVLGQMSAGINHELNQPLTAIRSYADNALSFLKLGKTDPVTSNLQEIGGLTERMAKIIAPLKEFSRKTTGQQMMISLKAVRDGAMSIMYGRLDKANVKIEWPEHLDQQFVLGDMLRLEQVVVNLISNALQAMEGVAEKWIEIGVERQGGRLLISFRDHGPGIPASELGKVFEPFYTTKKAGQGLGLGLSISHRIIESMDGQLSVSNHPFGGAVFTINLPAADASDSIVGLE